jgi:hypothetical protein
MLDLGNDQATLSRDRQLAAVGDIRPDAGVGGKGGVDPNLPYGGCPG